MNWGSYAARWHTAEFERVWKATWHKLAGQWRYENMLPFAKEPRFTSEAVKEAAFPFSMNSWEICNTHTHTHTQILKDHWLMQSDHFGFV